MIPISRISYVKRLQAATSLFMPDPIEQNVNTWVTNTERSTWKQHTWYESENMKHIVNHEMRTTSGMEISCQHLLTKEPLASQPLQMFAQSGAGIVMRKP